MISKTLFSAKKGFNLIVVAIMIFMILILSAVLVPRIVSAIEKHQFSKYSQTFVDLLQKYEQELSKEDYTEEQKKALTMYLSILSGIPGGIPDDQSPYFIQASMLPISSLARLKNDVALLKNSDLWEAIALAALKRPDETQVLCRLAILETRVGSLYDERISRFDIVYICIILIGALSGLVAIIKHSLPTPAKNSTGGENIKGESGKKKGKSK